MSVSATAQRMVSPYLYKTVLVVASNKTILLDKRFLEDNLLDKAFASRDEDKDNNKTTTISTTAAAAQLYLVAWQEVKDIKVVGYLQDQAVAEAAFSMISRIYAKVIWDTRSKKTIQSYGIAPTIDKCEAVCRRVAALLTQKEKLQQLAAAAVEEIRPTKKSWKPKALCKGKPVYELAQELVRNEVVNSGLDAMKGIMNEFPDAF